MQTLRTCHLLAAYVALASCGGVSPDISQLGGELIECALDGSQQFKADCRMKQVEGAHSIVTVIYHPDGGFRRFETLSPAIVRDGALEAQSQIVGSYLVLSVDNDRYRWPKEEWNF